MRTLAIFLSLAFGVSLLSSCGSGGQSVSEQAVTRVQIVHGLEVADFLNQARQAYLNSAETLPDGSKPDIELKLVPTFDAVKEIANGELKVHAWVSPGTALINLLNYQVVNLGQPQTECTPLYSSPVVIAVALRNAKLLSENREISWVDLYRRRRLMAPTSTTDSKSESAIPVTYSHAEPSASSSGFAGFMQLAHSAVIGSGISRDQSGPTLTRSLLNHASVLELLKQYESGVSNFSPFDEQLLRQAARSDSDRIRFVVTTEQQVALFNSKNPDSPIIALYPASGSYVQDFRICLSKADWVGPAQTKIIREFRSFLEGTNSQRAVKRLGFRPQSEEISDEFLLAKKYGVDTSFPKKLLEAATGDSVAMLLERWPGLKGNSATVIVVDTSGSMDGIRLDITKQLLRTFAVSSPDNDLKSLIKFTSEPSVALEFTTNRKKLIEEIDSLSALGGSAIYDALSLAFQRLSRENLESYRKTILMITDGSDKNSNVAFDALANRIQKRLAEEEIQLIILGIDNDETEMKDLEEIATRARGVFKKVTINQLPGAFTEIHQSL